METPEKKGLRETQMLSPVELRGTGGTEGCTWEGFGHAQVAGGGQELGDCNLGVTCRREQVCAEGAAGEAAEGQHVQLGGSARGMGKH